MGSSGAGKTTFLAALAGRLELTHGSVRVNGRVISRKIMANISSYMPQSEAVPSYLTLEEYVSFACALKSSSTAMEREYLSKKLLIELGLNDCKDTLISELSGGQRKRLSFATELMTRPKILFLDEPTTGLDTFSAVRVVESLKLISSSGTIVFCTIHQPGMAIYNLFSHVILMADGRVAYSGNLENVTEFFSSQGYVCPVGFDESEYYIKILSARNYEAEEETMSMQCIEKICEAFSQSPLSTIPVITDVGCLVIDGSTKKPGFIVQLRWLMWRIRAKNRRTIFMDWTSWLSYFLSIAAVCTFYYGVNPRTQEGVRNARGALYMTSSEIVFTIAYSVIYELPYELPVYIREGSMYGCGPYYIATFLGLIPKAILKALIFTIMLYLIINVEYSLHNFALYCLCTCTAALCSIAYGMLFSSWIVDVEVATTLMTPIDMLFLLTAGVFYNLRSLPAYLAPFKYWSVFFYLNEALSIIYWTGVDKIECDADTDLPCLTSGEEVLSEYGYSDANFRWDLAGIASVAIAMNLLGYIGIRRRRAARTIL